MKASLKKADDGRYPLPLQGKAAREVPGAAADVDYGCAGRRGEQAGERPVFGFADPAAARCSIPRVISLGRQFRTRGSCLPTRTIPRADPCCCVPRPRRGLRRRCRARRGRCRKRPLYHRARKRWSFSGRIRERRARPLIRRSATLESPRRGAAPCGLSSEAFRRHRTKAGSTDPGNTPRSRDSQGACAVAWPTGATAS